MVCICSTGAHVRSWTLQAVRTIVLCSVLTLAML